MNRTTRTRLIAYALILTAAGLGYWVKHNPDSTLVTPLGVTSSILFMAGALLALQAILQRIKDQRR